MSTLRTIRRDGFTATMLFLLWLVVMVRQWGPLEMTHLRPGLDVSWTAVLGEASAGRFGFGSDVVFTGGPLSFVYTRYYDPRLIGTYVLVHGAILVVSAALLTRLVLRARSWSVLGLACVVFVFGTYRDTWFLVLPLLATLVFFQGPGERASRVGLSVGVVATAIATLAKFSLFPSALACFGLVDLSRMRARRLPIALPTYLLAFLFAFWIFAPRGSDFVAYLLGSLDTSSGYTEAMSLGSHRPELGLFWAGLALVLVGTIWLERWNAASVRIPRRELVAASLALGVFFWIAYKAGFVRSDLHVLIAYSAVTIGGLAFALARGYRLRSAPLAWVMLALGVGLGIFAQAWSLADRGHAASARAHLEAEARMAAEPVEQVLGALAAPREWLRAEDAKRAAGKQSLISALSLPPLRGSIACVTWDQAALISARTDFRPFPSVQEYTSYTPLAIDRDLAFLRGPRAPDYLLFAPVAIDGRLPAMAEGPLWPEILERYEPARFVGSAVLLRRREQPLRIRGPARVGRARFGDDVRLEGEGPFFVSLDVELSWFGRLRSFFYKVPPLRAWLTMESGRVEDWRLIRRIAGRGFVLSPRVASPADFIRLASGDAAPEDRRVRAFRIGVHPGRATSYRGEYRYRVETLRRDVLAAGVQDDAVLGSALRSVRAFDDVLAANGPPSPLLAYVPEGLLVHPDRAILLPRSAFSRLHLIFGIRPDAYADGRTTDGVCFALRTGDGHEPFRRCLRPASEPMDRGDQSVEIELPPVEIPVYLQTECIGSCDNDWSYVRALDWLP